MAVSKLAAAVIGTGYIGEQHARVYAEHPLVDLRTVVDRDEDRARRVAEAYGADRVATDAAAALGDDPVDVVSVATPESHHVGPTEAALTNGCHVLLEKPIAETEADARRIGEAVDASAAELMVGYLCRFHPRYAALKREVDDGAFGDLRSVQAARVASRDRYRAVASWSHPVYYLAVHDVDAMRWYTGAEVERVYAEASAGLGDRGTPAAIHATLRFTDGTVGGLEVNWGRSDEYPTVRTDEMRITGTEGYGRLVNEGPGDAGLTVSSSTGHRYPATDELYGERNGFLRREIDHFVERTRAGEPPMVDWRDGLESLRVANAIRESVDAERPVALDH